VGIAHNHHRKTDSGHFAHNPTAPLEKERTCMSELTANKTFYVRTDGNDTNNGLTTGNAFLTLQRAADETKKWKTGEFKITVDIGKGSFPLYSSFDPAHPDGPNILWKGVVTDLDPEDITSYQGQPINPNQSGVWYGELLSEIPELSGHLPDNPTALHAAILIKGATGGTGTVFLNGLNQCYLWHENSDTLHWTYPFNSYGFIGRPTLPYTFDQFKLIETEITLMGTDGIVSSSGGHCGCWDNISIFNYQTTDYVGVCMSNRSTIVLGPDFGIYRCAPALLCQSNGTIYADGSYHAAANSINSPLVLAESGGFISVRDSILKATAREAVIARDNGTIDLQGSDLYCTGYPHSVKAIRCGSINAANTTVLGCSSTNSIAFYMDTEGYIDSTDATDDAVTSRNQMIEPDTHKLLDASKTIYVRTNGNDSNGGYESADAFLTPARAIRETQKYRTGDYTITINLGEGQYSVADALDPAHSDGHNITWEGIATEYTSQTVNNIDASTTSYGTGLEYIDFDVNLPPGSGTTVNDYVLIKETSGGTNPNLVKGCHEIVAWNGTTNVATVRCVRTDSSTTLPSGTITANLTLVKTILGFSNAHGIYSIAGKHCGNWKEMVLTGSSGKVGVSMGHGSKILLSDNFGTSCWDTNLSAVWGSNVLANKTVHSYAYSYIVSASTGSFISLRNHAILNGGGNLAVRAFNNATVDFLLSEVYCGGHPYNIQALRGGFVFAGESNVEGCVSSGSIGFYVSSGGGIDLTDATDDAESSRGQGVAPQGNGSYHVY
jgi:hypothetical protein